jgi:Transglycosylase SLT domain
VDPVSARHKAASAPAPTGPAIRTTVLATAAAVGAVTTGTFTALVPSPGDTATTAAADEFTTSLASDSSPLTSNLAALVPVSFAVDAADDASADSADEHLAMLDKATTLAAQLAELHAKQAREQAENDRITALINRGGLDGWIAEALHVMDMPQSYAPGLKKIIMAESGGNPRAINTWDSNARRGTPSRGLMQTIPSTFRAYVHPDLAGRSINDPVANITAGVRYMIDRYGVDTVRAGGRSGAAGGYLGY